MSLVGFCRLSSVASCRCSHIGMLALQPIALWTMQCWSMSLLLCCLCRGGWVTVLQVCLFMVRFWYVTECVYEVLYAHCNRA
jgi:hypothetical protein